MVTFDQVMQKNNEAVDKMISGSVFMANETFRQCLIVIKTQLRHHPTSREQAVSQDNSTDDDDDHDVDDDASTRSSKKNLSFLFTQIRKNLSFHPHALEDCCFDDDKNNNNKDAISDETVMEGFIHTRPIVFTSVQSITTDSHLSTTTTTTTATTTRETEDHATNHLLSMIGTLVLVVATFNLGLMYHVRGKSTSNPTWLQKARQLYQAVLRLLTANPSLCPRLLLVTINNYSQLCLELGEDTLAEQAAGRVWLDHLVTERQRLPGEESRLLFGEHEWGGIMRNMFVLSFSSKYPSCSPAA